MEYLEKFISTLSEPQIKELNRMLGEYQDSGKATDDESLRNIIEHELEDLELEEKPSMTIREAKEQTNSSDYNSTLTEIHNDLKVLFSESAKIDKVLYDHQKLDKSVLSDISKGIKQLNDKIDSYEVLIRNTNGYIQNIYETFRNKDSFEDNSRYIKDRNGEISTEATINNTTETLILPSSSEYNRLISSSGAKLASIKITDQIGSGFISVSNSHSIDKAIDGSGTTFWCSVVLTDRPLNVPWYRKDGSTILDSGAACKFEIIFQSISPVSEITLKPFTEFPIEVISILTYENLNRDTLGIPVIHRPLTSEETITVRFPARECQKIEFIIRQPNYTKQTYLISESQIRNVELWQKIYNATSSSLDISSNSNDEFWNIFEKEFRNKIKQIKPNTPDEYIEIVSEATKETLSPNSKKKLVNKYEYVYGMYEIEVYGKNHLSSGVYVSKPIYTKSNIRQVSLNASIEEMYLKYNSNTKQIEMSYDTIDPGRFQATSVEWYVSPKEEPDIKEWFPILPLEVELDSNNRPHIGCELLIPDNNGECCTRFPIAITAPVIVRKNGAILDQSEYSIGDYGNLINQKVTIDNYVQMDTYMIDYYTIPVTGNGGKDDFRIVDFTEPYISSMAVKPVLHKDTYTSGTDRKKSIQLSRFPYIDYEKINIIGLSEDYNPNKDMPTYKQPIKVIINDGEKTYLPVVNISNTTDRTYNITDYVNGAKEVLVPYSESNKRHEYRQDQKEITFAKEWPAGTTITVEYYYQVDTLRVKAILRRVVPGFDSITPVIKSYALKLRAVNRVTGEI